jgi:glyoxylase-like metal-dependent hydrolase (beta-lactamase superfamily II)
MDLERPLLTIAALGVLANACGATFPEVTKREVTPAVLPANLPGLAPCILVGESVDRRLFNGIDAISFDIWHQAYASIVVRHPAGIVIFDPAFSRTIAADLRKAPLIWRPITGSAEDKVPVGRLLEQAGLRARDVRFLALTHAHWDHAGGISDLPEARILLWARELKWIQKLERRFDHGVIRAHVLAARARVAPFEMDGASYEGFASSHDLFGDGAIVAVPLPGHTPGSVGYFINSGDGRRWLLIGDAAWTIEGVKRPAHKNVIASALVDVDRQALSHSLAKLHAFFEFRKDVSIVPAHDLAGLETMPRCTPDR